MTDIPVQVSIDRTLLTLSPLVIKSDRTTSLTLVGYREPARQKRMNYSPGSDYLHGETLLSWAYQQALLVMRVAAQGAATEQDARDAVAELETALEQFHFDVAVTVNDASAVTWRCDPGSVVPADDRQYVDLRDHDPVWNVSIPCYPVPVS